MDKEEPYEGHSPPSKRVLDPSSGKLSTLLWCRCFVFCCGKARKLIQDAYQRAPSPWGNRTYLHETPQNTKTNKYKLAPPRPRLRAPSRNPSGPISRDIAILSLRYPISRDTFSGRLVAPQNGAIPPPW